MVESSQCIHSPVEQSPISDHTSSSKYDAASSKVKTATGWNISGGFEKPRMFCLEHAIEIEGLLSTKGGANVLVICHSGNIRFIFLCIGMLSEKLIFYLKFQHYSLVYFLGLLLNLWKECMEPSEIMFNSL